MSDLTEPLSSPYHSSRSETDMNRKFISISLCALALLVSGSYFETAHAVSSRACDAFARDYERNASRQGQVVRCGALGGLLGLGIGAAAGGAGAGAAIGGGVGALSGGRARQRTADKIYWAAYRDCMAGWIR
jgi:H+/Cl- antiporter ClcA